MVTSYRERFKCSLPHPKLDVTAKKLSEAFESGEKSLVFVRRIATVTELQSKLGDLYDQHLRQRFDRELPVEMRSQIARLFDKYESTKRNPLPDGTSTPLPVDDDETIRDQAPATEEEDEGGTETFFSYFFRGKGPRGKLSGAAMQRNRFASEGATYSTFFEDNDVAWLLRYPDDVFEALSLAINVSTDELNMKLQELAYALFRSQSQRSKGYPRRPVFEAYQFAGLTCLAEADADVSPQAADVLRMIFSVGIRCEQPPTDFPDAGKFLNIRTLFTEIASRPELRQRIWPDETDSTDFPADFRRREQRRILVSAMSRCGASYVDLYLLAIQRIGSFDLKDDAGKSHPVERLITDFLDLLEAQMRPTWDGPRFNAFRELSSAAEVFDTLMAVNFADVHEAKVSEFATIVGHSLQQQQPIGGVFGGVNKRLVKQFRMPGYPLVLITTDVLQEGEDLHTFCARVLHYGISWTPSAMEQRTGRIDRIGSLAQRNLETLDRAPLPDELIQVHYPHLADTVERLQVRKVLQKLNRFMTLIHERKHDDDTDSCVHIAREMLQPETLPACIEGLLPSGFPVSDEWLRVRGQLGKEHVKISNLDDVWSHFDSACDSVIRGLKLDMTSRSRTTLQGKAAVSVNAIVPWLSRAAHPSHREQPFLITLRSRSDGKAILVRVSSPVGGLKLKNDNAVDDLYRFQKELNIAKVCTRYETQHHCERVSVESDLLFSRSTTQQEELSQSTRDRTGRYVGTLQQLIESARWKLRSSPENSHCAEI